jgi:hypothetical protein
MKENNDINEASKELSANNLREKEMGISFHHIERVENEDENILMGIFLSFSSTRSIRGKKFLFAYFYLVKTFFFQLILFSALNCELCCVTNF